MTAAPLGTAVGEQSGNGPTTVTFPLPAGVVLDEMNWGADFREPPFHAFR